jgi:integrase/recombinase XerD
MGDFGNLEISGEASLTLDLRPIEKLPLSVRSRELITTVAKDFSHFLERQQGEFNWEGILAFLAQQQLPNGAPLKPASMNSKRYALKKLLLTQPQFAHPTARATLHEAFKTLKNANLDLRVHEEEYLSKEEIELLVEHCLRGKDRQVRIGIIVQALFESGCRVSELINIRLDDCQQGEFIRIRILGKGQKERWVFMKPKTFNQARTFFAGKTYLFESENDTTLFRNNVFRTIQRMSRRAGLKKIVHPHTLRHSCAMYLIKVRNLNPKAVSEYLGHSDVAITLKSYVHDMPSAQEIFGI